MNWFVNLSLGLLSHIQKKHSVVVTLSVCALSVSIGKVHAEVISYLSPDENGYWQVWMVDTSQKKLSPTQITFGEFDKSSHSWHPNGEKILINGSQGQLQWVDITSKETISITTRKTGFIDATLSNDGKKIAFSLSTLEAKNDNNIWIYHLDSHKQEKVTNLESLQYTPVWSKDDKKIYYVSFTSKEEQDGWELDVATKSKRQLTHRTVFNMDLAHKENDSLYLSSNRNGNYDIWMRSGYEFSQITTHPSFDGNPEWSDTTKQLYFDSTRNGRSQIFTIKEDVAYAITDHKYGARKPKAQPRSFKESS